VASLAGRSVLLTLATGAHVCGEDVLGGFVGTSRRNGETCVCKDNEQRARGNYFHDRQDRVIPHAKIE
jgi:hypothetical protein